MYYRWVSLLILFSISVGITIGWTRLSNPQIGIDYYSKAKPSVSSPATISSIAFPDNYRQQFMQYATVDCPNSQIVRKMYVNREALETIAASQTVPEGTVIVMETHAAQTEAGERLVPNRLNNVFIRKKQPDQNGDPQAGPWQSVWYSPAGSLVSADQSSCISCHTGVRDRDYVFTLPALIAAAQTGQLQYQQTEFGTSVCR